MEENKVVLIRKQNTPFTVNYPTDGGVKKYTWAGTQGKVLSERPVPFEVYEWIAGYTTTFAEGLLIVKPSDNEDVIEVKENIENIESVENAVLTKEEVVEMLNSGNHLSLKKKLNELTNNKPEKFVENQKRYIVGIASDVGIDSSAKRQILVEWAGLDYENSDLLFDKHLKDMYEKQAK